MRIDLVVLIYTVSLVLSAQMSDPLKKGGVDGQDSSLFDPLREALNVPSLDEQPYGSTMSTSLFSEYDPSSINLTIYTTSFNEIFPCSLSKKYFNSATVTMLPTSSHNLFDAYLTVDTQAEAEAFVRESRAYIASLSNPPHAIYYSTSHYPMIATKDVLPTCVLDMPGQYLLAKPMDAKTKYARSLYLPHPLISLRVPTTVNYGIDAHTEISPTVVGVCMLATSAACLAIMRKAAKTPLLRYNLTKLSPAHVRRLYAHWAHSRLFAGMAALFTPGLLPWLLLRADMREGFAREAGDVSLEQSFTRPVMVVNRENDTVLETDISLTMRVPVHEDRVAENALAMTLLTLLLVAVMYPVTARLVLRRMDQHDTRTDHGPPDIAAEVVPPEIPAEVPPGFTHAVRAHIPVADHPSRLLTLRSPSDSRAWVRVPLAPYPPRPLEAGATVAPLGSLAPLSPLVHEIHERISRGAPVSAPSSTVSTPTTHPVPRISAASPRAPLPAPAPPVQAAEVPEVAEVELSPEPKADTAPDIPAPEQSLSASLAPERHEVLSTYSPRMHPSASTLSIAHPLPLPLPTTGLDTTAASGGVAATVGAVGTRAAIRAALPPPQVLYRYDVLGERVAIHPGNQTSLRARVATWASQLLDAVKSAFKRPPPPLASTAGAAQLPAAHATAATTTAAASSRSSLRDLYRGALPYHGAALLLLFHMSAYEFIAHKLRPVEHQPLRKLFETDTFRGNWLLSLPAVATSCLVAYPVINRPMRNAFHQRTGTRPWALAGFSPFFARMLLLYTLAAKMLHHADATGVARERAVIRTGYPASLSALLPPPPAPPRGLSPAGARYGPSSTSESAGPHWWEYYLRGVRPADAPTPADVEILRQYAQECSKAAYWRRHPERYVEDEQIVVLNKTNTLHAGENVTYVRHLGSPQTQTSFGHLFDLTWWLSTHDSDE